MKFILCSVCLVHGAVVYTVCTPFSAGLYQNQNPCCTFEASQSKTQHESWGTIPQPTKRKAKTKKKSSLGISGKTQDSWQVIGDFSVESEYDITIHFTVDNKGNASNIKLSPFSLNSYNLICNQMKNLKFVWNSSSPPPIQTTFEKEICVR